MGIVMKGNYFFVSQGEPAFEVASNYTNYLELGARESGGHYLQARIEQGEFAIDADLYDSHGDHLCRVVDNVPQGGNCRKEMTTSGWQVFGPTNDLVLGVEVHDNVCSIRGVLYDSKGEKVAEGNGSTLLIHKGPAVLGKAGNALGMVIS